MGLGSGEVDKRPFVPARRMIALLRPEFGGAEDRVRSGNPRTVRPDHAAVPDLKQPLAAPGPVTWVVSPESAGGSLGGTWAFPKALGLVQYGRKRGHHDPHSGRTRVRRAGVRRAAGYGRRPAQEVDRRRAG